MGILALETEEYPIVASENAYFGFVLRRAGHRRLLHRLTAGASRHSGSSSRPSTTINDGVRTSAAMVGRSSPRACVPLNEKRRTLSAARVPRSFRSRGVVRLVCHVALGFLLGAQLAERKVKQEVVHDFE